MLKNLKHSIVFILIVITLLLIVIMSLAASKPVSQNEIKGISIPLNPIINGKWSGLGMGLFSTSTTSTFDGYVDTLIANGFTSLRIDIPDYQNTNWLELSKAAVTRAVAKGADVTWGVSSNGGNNADYVITTENWPTYRQAILDAAAWAQANGVYEFQLGNEEELHIYRYPISITRTDNVATATFAENHGFTAANPVNIWYASPSNFNAYPATITVTGAKTFTYPSIGNNGSVLNPGAINISNISEGTLQSNLKSAATDVQTIFTRGNISYTAQSNWTMEQWRALGRGDIDILAWNVYQNNGDWQGDITNMISYWGTDHTYITEFGLNSSGLDSYSADESVQAAALNTMVEYVKAAGVTRANYFCYASNVFGALKGDGNYRQLWNFLVGTDTPISTPDITVSPISNDFISTDINSTTNPEQSFTITNIGASNITVGTITITGTDSVQFKISNDTASGQTIAAGESKTLIVTFDPTSIGTKTATLSIPSTDPVSPTLTADLTGIGSETIITGSIVLTKTGLVSGISGFTLYNSNNQVIGSENDITSLGSTNTTWTNVPYGSDYKIVETTVPEGYLKMPDITGISITAQGQIVNITVDADVERTAQDTAGTVLDNTAPNITGLSNDTNATDSKTWTWDADEPATFRYLIDDKPVSTPTGVYSNTTTTTISDLNGIYYMHIQAKDTAGNESAVVTVSAVLTTPETTAPDTTGVTEGTTIPATTVTDTIAPDTIGVTDDTTTTTDTAAPDTATPDTTGVTNATTVLDNTAPNITGLSNDTNATDSKTWTWDADEPATFRYLIDDKPVSTPTGVYSNTTTTTISDLNGIYYMHIQAKDTAGNESAVVTVSAVLTTPETIPPETSGDTNDSTATVTITYTTAPHTTEQADNANATTPITTTPDTSGITNGITATTTETITSDTTNTANSLSATVTTPDKTTPDTTGLSNDTTTLDTFVSNITELTNGTNYIAANSVKSLAINNNESTTMSKTVTLSIESSGTGLISMQFANSSKGPWSTLEPYSSTKSGWSLSNGPGTKTVYAKIFDNAGNYNIKSDTIRLIPGSDKISPKPASEPITSAQKVIINNRIVFWFINFITKLRGIFGR